MKSGMTIFTMFMLYRPGRFFASIGTIFLILALILGFRFIYLIFGVSEPEPGRTYLPSLILMATCALSGFILYLLAVLGELIKFQRRLQEEVLFRLRRKK